MMRLSLLSFALLALTACSRRTPEKPAPPTPPPAPVVAATDAAPPPPPPSPEAATAAYEAKQYGTCAQQYMALASDDARKKRSSDLYNAARCYNLDGKADVAFTTLDGAIAAGFHNVSKLEKDGELANLRADARWAKVLDAVKAQFTVWEASLGQPKLRRELLAMVEVDQAARNKLMAVEQNTPGAKALNVKITAIDKKNTKTIKAVIAKQGWPGKSQVGDDGAQAAWLLVQHADDDLAFQKRALALMKPMVDSRELRPLLYAYLYDRVAVAEKRPQLYGTQFNGSEPFAIEDEAHVDERRKAVGLGTLAEYREQMTGPPKK